MIVEIMMALPGVGKSHWARARASQGWVVVDIDKIVEMVHGGDYTKYDPALKPLYKTIERMAIGQALKLGKNVVIDRNCYKRKTRMRFIHQAKAWGAKVRIVRLYNPDTINNAEAQALIRFKKDNRGLTLSHWTKAVEFMIANENFPPDDEEQKQLDCYISMPVYPGGEQATAEKWTHQLDTIEEE